MNSRNTRYDEDIAASFLDDSIAIGDIYEEEALSFELDCMLNRNGASNHEKSCEAPKIDEDVSFHVSEDVSEDDTSWGDYEVEYDYTTDFYHDSTVINAEGDILLSNEVEEVMRRYGKESIFSNGPPAKLLSHFGPVLCGIVYLCFPSIGGPLDRKRNLSEVWGFDPSQPVIVRLRAMMHLFSESVASPLKVCDLGVTVFQGNEPLDLWTARAMRSGYSEVEVSHDCSENESDQDEEKKPSEKDDSSDKSDGNKNEDEESNQSGIEPNQITNKTNEGSTIEKEGDDKTPNQKKDGSTEKDSSSSSFRLGSQIQRIAEEFLVANMRGNGRKESTLTLPLANSSENMALNKSRSLRYQQCPRCTFLNTDNGAENCHVCEGPLSANKVTHTDDDNDRKSLQSQCGRCMFINQIKSKKCEACAENLLNSHPTNPLPKATTSSTRSREKMLQAFLNKSQLGGKGLLARLYAYLTARMPQLHRFCVNCDSPHLDFFGGLDEPIRPSVCRRDLCSWAFIELGVGSTSTDELASSAEVMDLLLAITTAAATSVRAPKILSPFPLLVRRDRERVLDPDQPDYEKAREIVATLPSMQQIVATNEEEDFEKICTERGEHVQGVLQWITKSCTAHLVSLRGDHRLSSMGTSFQFLMQSASREREIAFAVKKRTHGSIFGFHGSPIENWHAILRLGVKNCSGTDLQMNGAAYGPGVYISPQAQMSLGYSKVARGNDHGVIIPSSKSGNQFISGEQVHILALCEIIDDNNITKRGSVWVVPDSRNVVTRFLFVFLPLSTGFNEVYDKASQCNTTNVSFKREINSAMDHIKGTYETRSLSR